MVQKSHSQPPGMDVFQTGRFMMVDFNYQTSLKDGEVIPDFEQTINRISVLELNHHGFTGFAIAIIT